MSNNTFKKLIISVLTPYSVKKKNFKRFSAIHKNYKEFHSNIPSKISKQISNRLLTLRVNSPLYIILRNDSCCQYKYSSEMEKIINRQILAEQQAAQDYLSMAVYFLHPSVSRPGTGGFFMLMYEEEIGHMQDFVEYQLTRGGNVVVPSLAAPVSDNQLSLFEAFSKALCMERNITQFLEEIVQLAETSKDYQCADFVTSKFLAEQMISINQMSHHVTKLARLCQDEHALYQFDLQLASSHPYKRKIVST